MRLIPFTNLGQYGIISQSDRAPHTLPLNAFSAGLNIRARDGYIEKCFGQEQAFSTPTIAPLHLMPASNTSNYFWTVAGLTKIHCWDGSAYTNVTRQTAGVDVDYAATAVRNWTGGVMGGIAYLNNGVDKPQFWVPNTANKFADLTNWPANYVAACLRPFRKFLVALDITDSGTRHKHRVLWSHTAASGAVPSSWDVTDPTLDAGQVDILDSDEPVVELTRMRDAAVIYKGDAVHLMQYTGGVDVFKFTPMFDSFGILSRRCAVEYARGKHAVFALGDLIKHDGQSWASIVDSRMRKWLFNQIDATYYQTSFVAWHPAANEVWFCFPSTGNSTPNKAVVWNYLFDTIGVKEVASAHIRAGNVVVYNSSDAWDLDSGVWDADSSVWGEGTASPAGLRLLSADHANTQVYRQDATSTNAGTAMTAYAERLSIPVPVTPDGPPDMRSRKFISGIYPTILGTVGGQVNVSLGTQETPESPITWLPSRPYIIGTTRQIDCRVNTVLLSIKFESDTAIEWKMPGFELEVTQSGRH